MKNSHKISIIVLIHILGLYSILCGLLVGFIIFAILGGLLGYRFLKSEGFKSKYDHWFGILGIGCGLLAFLDLHPFLGFIGLYGFGVFSGLLISNIAARKHKI